jgi:hypothetical protein
VTGPAPRGIDAWPSGFRERRPLGTVFPARDSDYDTEFHDQAVVRAWEGTPIGVDVAMAPLLTGLWRLGYRTLFSCQGSERDEGFPAPDSSYPRGTPRHRWAYILFAAPAMAGQFLADLRPAEYKLDSDEATVRFPAGAVQELRAGLLRRGVITQWEDAREAAMQKAGELESVFAGHQSVTEAELAAQGLHPVTVAHGTPETNGEQALLDALAAIALECGPLAATRGGSEHTTYLFAGPAASASAAAFTARVTGAAPYWWRVTPTAWPSWRPEAGHL